MKNLLLLITLSVCMILGCQTTKKNTKPKIVYKKVEKGPKVSAKNIIRIAFESPVIAVDDVRAKKVDDPFAVEQEKIIKEYAKNSTNDISITFKSSHGEERVIHGTIKVFDYSQKASELAQTGKAILISPNSDLAYEDIWVNGYGRIVASEIVPQDSEEPGAELVQIVLGSRKKKSSGVEFHFREGSISSVNDKYTPYNLTFPTNSKQNITLSLDEGLVSVKGQLEIFKGTEYTNLAPVWVDLDSNTQEILKRNGGEAKIAISVPDEKHLGERNVIVPIQTEQDPIEEGSKFGTVIAVLNLRQTSE